ncbi:MAG: nucleoside triphosphate pyrophosphohydrolase [Acidobacteriota bacterium]
MSAWQKLLDIMRRLRAEDGCPWDREQTVETLRAHLIEEAYEVFEAIQTGDWALLKEELGDLLFQILFLAQIASEEGEFDVEEVAAGIADKLVRRHPHVFAETQVKSAAQAIQQWEALKAAERRGRGDGAGVLSGVPRSLPALLKAYRLTDKASQFGVDWRSAREVLHKLEEEMAEFERARLSGDAVALEEEIGDVLFTLANVGRHLSIDPEAALQRANQKFIQRFEHMEARLRERGRSWNSLNAQDLDQLWEGAKRRN